MLEFVIRDLVFVEKNLDRILQQGDQSQELANLKSSLEKLKTENSKNSKAFQDKINSLNFNLAEKEVNFSKKISEINAAYEKRITFIQEEAKILKSSKNNLESQNLKLSTENASLKNNLDQNFKSIETLNSDINQLKEKNYSNSALYEIAKNNLENLKKDNQNLLDQAKQQEKTHQSQLSHKDQILQKIEEKVKNLELQVEKFKILEVKISAEKSNLEKSSQILTDKNSVLDAEIACKNQKISSQNSEIKNLEEKIAISEDLLIEKESELIEINQNKAVLENKISELLAENEVFSSEIEKSKQAYNELYKNYNYLVNVNESLSKKSRVGSIPSSSQKMRMNGLNANRMAEMAALHSGQPVSSLNSLKTAQKSGKLVTQPPGIHEFGDFPDDVSVISNSSSKVSQKSTGNHVQNLHLGYIKPVVLSNGVYTANPNNSRAGSRSGYSDKLLPTGSIPEKYLNAMKKMEASRKNQWH